ncbi:MAG: sugar phosphate isomerase/epimerase [Clostridia bacterium]|nr:sugar phosphate isomerase/epimerase [Clostridia bacterium]
MNIGIRLHDTSGTTLREHLQSAKAQGFSCVHLALSKTVPGFSMKDAPALMTDDFAREVSDALQETGLQCAVLGCYLNPAVPDEGAWQDTLAIYRAHLAFARKIGALCVGTETGAPNMAYKTEPACWTEEALELTTSRLGQIVKAAEEEDALFAIEPVCRHIVSTPERAKKVLDALPSDHLRIILDAVNLLTPQNLPQADQVIRTSIRLFGDKILVLHMKDVISEEGATDLGHLSRACGLGTLNYTDLLSYALAHPGIPMTLEDTKPDNAVAARLFLEEKAAELS